MSILLLSTLSLFAGDLTVGVSQHKSDKKSFSSPNVTYTSSPFYSSSYGDVKWNVGIDGRTELTRNLSYEGYSLGLDLDKKSNDLTYGVGISHTFQSFSGVKFERPYLNLHTAYRMGAIEVGIQYKHGFSKVYTWYPTNSTVGAYSPTSSITVFTTVIF
jgi:hypothetical protein